MRTPRWTRHGLVIALLGLIAGLLISMPSAQATSSILCKGFSACKDAGYSSFGYGPSNYRNMYWRMYSGHNCTNYMAYRMIKAGMSETRPWSGSGDARNWGVVFRSKTDQTPSVGAVAWWSSNHVAYVQEVVDANTIIISEDHYRGDFDWRKIVRSGGGWPTGFIHLVDEELKATTPPVVTGTPQVDVPLSVSPGKWSRSGVRVSYQWLADGKAIPGATGPTYAPSPEHLKSVMAVRVRAAKSGFRTGATRARAAGRVLPGELVVEGDPVVTGIPKVGATVTGVLPAFEPAPETFTYAWFANGKFVKNSSVRSIVLSDELLGKSLRFVATAKRAGYTSVQLRSEAVPEVWPVDLTVTKEPRLAGNPLVGRPFTVRPGAVDVDGTTTSFQWFNAGTAIRGATSATYTPTTSDPGARLSVRVAYTKTGFSTIQRELKPQRAVKSLARIRMVSRAHKTVRVTVKADGVSLVRGEVVLTTRNGHRRTLTLDHGTATFDSSWLRAGNRFMTLTYKGSFRVEERTIERTVQVQ